MKKLSRTAALLAFVLAFAGCSDGNDPEPAARTLQDALNSGGTINLDDYQISSAQTYTVGSTSTITGSAKGASFIIAAGVGATFDGTKQIGTVIAGTPGGRSAAVRAAKASGTGTSISLRGSSVTISSLFIHVDCTLDSNDLKNSFGNIVVAETVENLALKGSTTVSALVSMGSSSITITVARSVQIEKADEAVIAAVKKNNPSIEIKPIPPEELKQLQDAFKEESEKDHSSEGNFIKSEEDLTACVKNIIKEYYNFVYEIEERNSQGRAAGTTKEELASQLIDFHKEYAALVTALLSGAGYDSEGNYYETHGALVQFFCGEGASEDFHFNAGFDLTDIGVNDALDAYIDAANNVNEGLDEDGDREPVTRPTLFGDNLEFANSLLNVADRYVSVPKLYALGTFDVSKDSSPNYASGSATVNIEAEATNINGFIPEFFKAYNTEANLSYIPASANLPVTGVRLLYNIDADAAMTKENYGNFVRMLEELPGWNGDDYDRDPDGYDAEYHQQVKAYVEERQSNIRKSFKCKSEYGISTTVKESAAVPGGIITVTISADHDFATLFTNIIAPAPSSNPLDAVKEMGADASVTVTDYNGNRTFSLSGIDKIAAIIEDIAESFGDIIQ